MSIPAAAAPATEPMMYVPANFWYFVDHTNVKHVFHLPNRKTSFTACKRDNYCLDARVAEQFNPKQFMEFAGGTMPECKLTQIPTALAEKLESIAKENLKMAEFSSSLFGNDIFAFISSLKAPAATHENDAVDGNDDSEFPGEEQMEKMMEAKLGADKMKLIEEAEAGRKTLKAKEDAACEEFCKLVESKAIELAEPVYVRAY